MKQETKKNIKVYSIWILIFVVWFLWAFFIQKMRYERKINLTPQIVYRKSYNYKTNEEIVTPKISYWDWFYKIKDQDAKEYNYIRVFNKKYVVPFEYNYIFPVELTVKNQLKFSPNQNYNIIKDWKILDYKSKYWFEQELKKVTNKNFLILNINNSWQNTWIVDFETEITYEEISKLYENLNKNTWIEYEIGYNIIVNPEYFNDNIYISHEKYIKDNWTRWR